MTPTKTVLLHSRVKETLLRGTEKPAHATLLYSTAGSSAAAAGVFYVDQLSNEHGLAKGSVVSVDASTATIEQIRGLKSSLQQKNNTDAAIARIVHLQNFDTLSVEAQNTMLKMIEEPTSGVIYVLTAQNVSAVLATVQSRCKTVAIQPPAREDYGVVYADTDQLNTVMQVARGNQVIIEQLMGGEDEALTTAKEILSARKFERLSRSAELAKDPAMMILVVTLITHILMYMYEQAVRTGATPQQKSLQTRIELCERTLEILTGSNANAKLTLDQLFVAL